jgi:hypothetical protein
MKFFIKFFILYSLVIHGLTQSVYAESQTWPIQPTDTQWSPIPYSILKYTFWNTEKFINQTLNLRSEYCQYTSLRTEKTYTHKEIGACVYHHLIDSLYSKNLQPSVFIWARNNQNKPIALKMDWRPHKGSVWEVLNHFFELKYEGQIEFSRKIYSFLNIDFETKRDQINNISSDSLLGEMTIRFKLDSDILDNIKLLFPQQIAPYLPAISQMNIKMKPDGRSKHYLQNNVSLEIFNADQTTVLYGEIKTNINILDTKRMFNASGELKTGYTSEQGSSK